MKNKCKIFFGTLGSVEKKMNTFFKKNDVAVQFMSQTEHSGLNSCTYITVTIIYLVEVVLTSSHE